MPARTIPGIFRGGRVELESVPPDLRDATPVTVAVPTPKVGPASHGADAGREASRERAIARMGEGFPLGGAPYPSRDELHERRDDDLRSLVDTNIVVDVHDSDEPEKQRTAHDLLVRLTDASRLALGVGIRVVNPFAGLRAGG